MTLRVPLDAGASDGYGPRMDLITSADAADLLGVSKRTVHRMIPDDLQPVSVTALGFLFDRADVVRLAAERAAADVSA